MSYYQINKYHNLWISLVVNRPPGDNLQVVVNRPPEVVVKRVKKVVVNRPPTKETLQKKERKAQKNFLNKDQLLAKCGEELTNIKINNEEYVLLEKKFGNKLTEYLKNFNYSIGAKNYNYKNHYMAILKWYDKPEPEKPLSFYRKEYEDMNENDCKFIRLYGKENLLKMLNSTR